MDEAALKKAQEEADRLSKENDSIRDLSPAQFSYWRTLSKSDQDSFLSLSSSEREKLAKPIYTSKDGEQFFAGDERAAKYAERADKSETKHANSAVSDLAKAINIPGAKDGMKETIAKAILTIEKQDDRNAIIKILTTENEIHKILTQQMSKGNGTTEIGDDHGEGSDAKEAFNKLVEAHREKHKVSKHEATFAVLKTIEGRKLRNEFRESQNNA